MRAIAFDLGASSGRAILGTLEAGRLTLEELHRFANTPVQLPTGLYWDTLRLFHEIRHWLTVAGRERLGVVTALNGLARSTGGAAGAALFGAVVFALIPSVDRSTLLQTANEADVAAILHAFHRAFFLAGCVAALGAFVASRMPDTALWDQSGGATK